MSGRPAARWRFGDSPAPLAALLAAGGVLAIPTESSYGLAAQPFNGEGVDAVFRIKGRPRGSALPVVVAGVDQLPALGLDPHHPLLPALAPFWPGPLTVALPFVTRLASPSGPAAPAGAGGGPWAALADGGPSPAGRAALRAAAAGGDSLAVRVPSHADLRALLEALGHGLTATSANRSGEAPILDPAAAAWLLAGEPNAAVIDGGVLPGGPPSTLIEPVSAAGGTQGVRILRHGSVPEAALRACLTVVA